MYLSKITIENFRCFGSGSDALEMELKSGLTALVGENDSGKTAIIDALRFVLGTTDFEWYRLEDTDFYKGDTKLTIKIVCKFVDLQDSDKRAFLEYLTHDKDGKEPPVLYVNWTAKETGKPRFGKAYRRGELNSGKNGDGPIIDPEVRRLLATTYLRPLRDAEQSLSAHRGSRLSQVLHSSKATKEGDDHNEAIPVKKQTLSLFAIGKLINELLEGQKGVETSRGMIDSNLEKLFLIGDESNSAIKVSGSDVREEILVRGLLEKLDLMLNRAGKSGLGSDNLLFMACELLLIEQEDECNKMLLIEEPEAHLHPQRQLRVMKHLQNLAETKGIQIIITTHSPNLASAIKLNNLVMISDRKAYSMAEGKTMLEKSDYRFLERFLDSTKANLFFARGVMIVEGDAENILIPTIARLIGRDFTEYGVSIVNVGGVGLRRYARIFQRKDADKEGLLNIPVACVTDMDVMPDCAPEIIGKYKKGELCRALKDRKWRTKSDISDLVAHRQLKDDKASGQNVKTFVSDEWTLEYDLALGPKDEKGDFVSGGIGDLIYVAACLAAKDDAINEKKVDISDIIEDAVEKYENLKSESKSTTECSTKEVLASRIYSKFEKDGVSKAVAAQYLADTLQEMYDKGMLSCNKLETRLPIYIVDAINYVTQKIIPTTDVKQTGKSE